MYKKNIATYFVRVLYSRMTYDIVLHYMTNDSHIIMLLCKKKTKKKY